MEAAEASLDMEGAELVRTRGSLEGSWHAQRKTSWRSDWYDLFNMHDMSWKNYVILDRGFKRLHVMDIPWELA